MCPDACSFPCLEALYLFFFLIKKVTKKIKANSFATFSLERKGGAKSSSRF